MESNCAKICYLWSRENRSKLLAETKDLFASGKKELDALAEDDATSEAVNSSRI